MIFISTGGESQRSATETALRFFHGGITLIELSGGSYSRNIEEELASLPRGLHLQVHNYFPPPEVPFVFNLASTHSEIATRSLEHVRNAIRVAVMLGRPIYSFHAGFRIDPNVSELGSRLGKHELLSRDKALEVFGDRIELLAQEAKREGVTLLIENNVINKQNFKSFGEDPLLLTHPDEITSFMKLVSSNIGLLIDVAHLKVSANTRSFDMIEAHERVKKWIKGYHLSENNGDADTNDPVSPQSWFWKYLVRGLDYYTLEVYRQSTCKLIAQRNLTEQMLTQQTNLEI
jgi:sugar phosphate isomerase/epimerase